MRRSEVRDFLEVGIALLFDVTYGSGRVSEFNSNRSREYPMAWIESLRCSTDLNATGLPTNTWEIRIHVADIDIADSVESQYEAIIDDCDYMAQQLIKYYNQVIDQDAQKTYKKVRLESARRDPFIKKNADCLTGVILNFNLIDHDNTIICEFTGPDFNDYAVGAVITSPSNLLALLFTAPGATPAIVPAGYNLEIWMSSPYKAPTNVRLRDMSLFKRLAPLTNQTVALNAATSWTDYVAQYSTPVEGDYLYVWVRYVDVDTGAEGPFYFKVQIPVIAA